MPVKKTKSSDANTEEKIRASARVVFHKKGYAATRTRDIAEEAGINLALLNYYYRSKEKLFQLIMMDTMAAFFESMGLVFNDASTTLEKKMQLMAEKYIDLFIEEPEIPLFIMSEMRSHGAELLKKLPGINSILQSVLAKQYNEAVKKGKYAQQNPMHFLMNLTGLVVFPFVNSPMLKKVGKLTDKQFDQLMQERKKMIPVWMNAMFAK